MMMSEYGRVNGGKITKKWVVKEGLMEKEMGWLSSVGLDAPQRVERSREYGPEARVCRADN